MSLRGSCQSVCGYSQTNASQAIVEMSSRRNLVTTTAALPALAVPAVAHASECGTHRNRDAAWEALEEILATRH